MHTKGRYSLTIGFVSLYPLQQYKRGERRIGKNSWDGNAEVLVSKGTPTISLPAHTSSVYVIYRSEDTDHGFVYCSVKKNNRSFLCRKQNVSQKP